MLLETTKERMGEDKHRRSLINYENMTKLVLGGSVKKKILLIVFLKSFIRSRYDLNIYKRLYLNRYVFLDL